MLAADPHMPWGTSSVCMKSTSRARRSISPVPRSSGRFQSSAGPRRLVDVDGEQADHADVYRWELDPENPDRYLHGGEWIDFERRDVEYRSDGTTRNEVLRWSVHGPVIHHDPEKNRAKAACSRRMVSPILRFSSTTWCDPRRSKTRKGDVQTAIRELNIVPPTGRAM